MSIHKRQSRTSRVKSIRGKSGRHIKQDREKIDQEFDAAESAFGESAAVGASSAGAGNSAMETGGDGLGTTSPHGGSVTGGSER